VVSAVVVSWHAPPSDQADLCCKCVVEFKPNHISHAVYVCEW
jgi:hypothetical protein